MPDLRTSTDIAWSRRGRAPGSAPALLFVHGLGCHQGFFDEVIDGLANQYDCVALDLSHHGRSGAPAGVVSIARFADDVAAVIEAAQLDRVVLVGHSMGAAVCVEAARRDRGRGRIPAIVALDALINPRVYPRQPGWLVALSRTVSRAAHPLMMRLLLRALMPAPRNSACFDDVSRSMLALPARVAADASASLAAWDRDAALRDTEARILLAPASAFYRPAETTALLETLGARGALLGPITGSHFYLREHPQALVACLQQVLPGTA